MKQTKIKLLCFDLQRNTMDNEGQGCESPHQDTLPTGKFGEKQEFEGFEAPGWWNLSVSHRSPKGSQASHARVALLVGGQLVLALVLWQMLI